MNAFIFSEIPAHLKVNGEYQGVVNGNLSEVEVDKTAPFFELYPKSQRHAQVYGDKTSKDIKIFNINNHLLVYPVYPLKNNHPFKVLGQKQQSSYSVYATVTVVCDGGVKFFLDGTVSDVKTLPFIPQNFEINIISNLITVAFSAEKTAFFIYDSESRKLVFSDVADGFFVSDNLTVKKSFSSVTKTSIEEEWTLSSTPTLISRKDIKERDFLEIHPYLLPLAFFENLIIGGSVKSILTPNLNERISDLLEFLGKALKVIPSCNNGEVWLIKNNGVTACKLEYENRLISNVLAEDY